MGQVKPHWKWVVGFILAVAVVSFLNSYFTYLSKRIVDKGITPGNREAMISIVIIYGGC